MPTKGRILLARWAQLLTLCVVLVGLWLAFIAGVMGALLAWERLVEGTGGGTGHRLLEGFFAILLCLVGVGMLAATLWLAWVGVDRVGARVAGAPLVRMTRHGGGFFQLATSRRSRRTGPAPPGHPSRRSRHGAGRLLPHRRSPEVQPEEPPEGPVVRPPRPKRPDGPGQVRTGHPRPRTRPDIPADEPTDEPTDRR